MIEIIKGTDAFKVVDAVRKKESEGFKVSSTRMTIVNPISRGHDELLVYNIILVKS